MLLNGVALGWISRAPFALNFYGCVSFFLASTAFA